MALALVAVLAGVHVPGAAAQSQEPKSGCTSNTQPETGYLESPGFNLYPQSHQKVRFRAWWEIESVIPSQDDFAIEYSTDGTTWTQATPASAAVFEPPSSSAGGAPDLPLSNQGLRARPNWTTYVVDLPTPAMGMNTKVRFRFEPRDNQYNGFRGLAVDGVEIFGDSPHSSYGFEGSAEGWTLSGFWRIQQNPQTIGILNPDINPTLVTLAEGDDGSLPPAFGGSSVAWYGEPETGTFCGKDFQRYRSPSTLRLDPTQSQLETGKDVTVTATLNSPEGPLAGQPIRYEISGPNATPAPQQITTDAGGAATISWTGKGSGVDTVSAYGDLNANGTLDADEPFATTEITWSGPPPPVVGRSVNLSVEEGIVLVKLPRGGTIVTKGGHIAQAKGFVPLTEAAQVPVGSIVNARKGTVGLTSAANLKGDTQSGSFSRGRFKIAQRRRAKPITDLRLTGGSFNRCRARAGRAVAARVIRRLRGSARGRFRTRGRYGSATVRGTGWTLTESCAGTLVSVQTGKVVVRDFARKRNVTVRKGRSYLARPRR